MSSKSIPNTQATTASSTSKDLVQGKIMEYVIGFVLSLGLTLTAYAFVVGDILQDRAILYVLALLAVLQAVVQLIFFLHLRDEAEPRWKLLVFDFMLVIVVIVVFGSIWIMDNLHYNMMPPHETDQQIMQKEGIYRE